MSDLYGLLAKFPQAKKAGGQWLVQCPAHEDRVASLAIREGTEGRLLLHCHAGCETDAILSTLGLDETALFAEKPLTIGKTIIATYDYTDEQGQLLYQVVRYEPKDFRQRRPDGKGGWLWNLTDTRRVVYRLHELQGKTGVLIVEGEKDANAAWALGIPATTNVGGCGKWTQDNTQQLVACGVQRGVVLPDNDVAGRSHTNHVGGSLTAAGIRVRLLVLPDVPPKGDLCDYLVRHTRDDLLGLLKDAPDWTPQAAAPPTPEPVPITTFQRTPEGRYVWAVMPPGVSFELDRVRRDHGELCGELTVRCDLTGTVKTQGGALMTADFNLSSARARSERAKLLAQRAKTGTDVDWFSMLEEFCERVFDDERTGAPALRLDEGEVPTASTTEAQVQIEGMTLLLRHPLILFGDGGTAKSYLALYLAGRMAQMGHRVLYADWELLPDEHRVRLHRLFGADKPEVWYVTCELPLVREQDRLRKTIRANNIDYIILDSVAVACDGPPEAAEVTASYFRALRSLGIGSSNLAHTNRSEQADKKPFGSSFWHNLARSTWFCQRAEDDEPNVLTVGLFNRKANLGPLRPATGFTFRFSGQQTEVQGHDIRDRAEFSGQIPLWQRIRTILERGPQTTAALAEQLEAKENSINHTIRRHAHVFERSLTADGVQRVRLVKGARPDAT